MSFLRKLFLISMVIITTLSLNSCLTCEKKEYVYQALKNDNIRLTIKYINIYSSLIDSAGEISKDYDELIRFWLEGDKLERDFPKAKKIKKRLYEQDGLLNGEIVMDFDSYKDARLYRFMNRGPYMFSLSAVNDDGENFSQSNGDFGGEMFPVVTWSDNLSTFRLITKIAPPDSTCVSMLDMWKNNYKKKRVSIP